MISTDKEAEFRPLGRDSLCPSGAAFVSTMPAPSGFPREAGCEKNKLHTVTPLSVTLSMTEPYKLPPFLHDTLTEMGFRKSSEHESAQDLYSISLKSGLELEISVITGKGRIFVHDDWDDVSMCDIPVQFEAPSHLYWFVQAIIKPTQPVEFYKSGSTGADSEPFPEWARHPA